MGGLPLHFHSDNTHLHSFDRVWSECGVFTSLPTLAIVHLLPLATLMELKYFPLDFVFSCLMTKDSCVLYLHVHAGVLYPASAVCTGLSGRSHVQMLTIIGQLQELMWLVLGVPGKMECKRRVFFLSLFICEV